MGGHVALNGFYSASDIQDYIEYIIKNIKH